MTNELHNMRIGVLAGGISAEREVSLKSGNAVFRALQGMGYETVLVDVSNKICETLKKEQIEIAFIALHGGYGENGALQGMLEVLGIPYTGSGVLASAIAMDKIVSKAIFMNNAIAVAPFVVFDRKACTADSSVCWTLPYVIKKVPFDLPWVIKPAMEGSSIGVSIVKEENSITVAMQNAFSYGDSIIVEKYIKGREIQIGVLDQEVLGGVEVCPTDEFYSYRDKYENGRTQYFLPPRISNSDNAALKKAALLAHNALGCAGATRVDFILDDSGLPFILEVNTIPGMTETSLLPKIARQIGLNFNQLVERILKSGFIRSMHTMK